MLTTDIIFDRKKKATKEKAGTIELRVTINRKSQYLSTGVRVFKHQWKNGHIVNCLEAEEKMRRLWAMKKRLEEEVALCMEQGKPINLQAMRDSLVDGGDDSEMWDWMKERIERLDVSGGTRAHYWNMMVKFEIWGKMRRFVDCTTENVILWDDYLHTLKKPLTQAQKKAIERGAHIEQEPLSASGIYNYHKCLKALLNRAFEMKKLQENPYERLKGRFSRGDKENIEYLIQEEIDRIVGLEGLSRIFDEARDLFVVQMFTGLGYSDLMAFRIDDYKEVDGKLVKRAERIKTGVPYVSQLLPPVVRVLAKYGNHLPRINNAEYNERLKVVGRLAEIDTPLHSHLGRHTFATWMLSNGVPIEHLSKMLGHTNITQTQRYAKVLAKDVRGSFDMIEARMREKAREGKRKK